MEEANQPPSLAPEIIPNSNSVEEESPRNKRTDKSTRSERVISRRRHDSRSRSRSDGRKAGRRDHDSCDREKRNRYRDDSRERDRYRGRDKERERDRGRDRNRDRGRDGEKEREKERENERVKEKEREREAEKEREKERERLKDPEVREMERKRREESLERRRIEREQEEFIMRKTREIDDLTKDQRTIFVSQLVAKVSERHLEDFFGQIGKVRSIIMLRDKNSGRHKGFAYVEMADLDAIPNCLLFNEVVPDFQKFPILVKASEAEKNFLAKKETAASSLLGSSLEGLDTRLYLGNLHINIDEAQLKPILEQFGPTESIKIYRDNLGNSKGFAFVKFVRMDSASQAMSSLQGTELAGRPLKVGPVVEQGTNPAVSNSMNIYGSNLLDQNSTANWKLDSDDGGAGMIMNANSRIALMAKLAETAGIKVPTPSSSAAAVSSVMGFGMPSSNSSSVVQNTRILVPPVGGTPSIFVLICNMFDPATETEEGWDLDIKEDVLEESNKFGAVEHCHVETKKPGGMVFLKFKAVEAAKKTANSMNGRFFAKRMITATFLDESLYYEMIHS